MTDQTDTPYEALERIFHEPNRLAIMSALCAADQALAFTELKAQCGLTDGNLSRHLKVLQEAGAIDITKAFVDSKPRTSIALSTEGLQRFEEYLSALDQVLKTARAAMPAPEKKSAAVPFGKTARA